MSAHLIVLRHLWVLRRNRPYQLIVNGIFEPFLYLLSIGFGIGGLIDVPAAAGPPGTTYAEFVAPALLATAAMNAAVNEVVSDVWWRIRFEKVYQSMLSTPVTVTDIALGEVAAAVLRSVVAATGFLAVISAVGLVHSWWALLALPATVLVTFGFAGAGLAVATVVRDFQHQQYVQLFMLPMFLFANTFYPLSVYPTPLQAVIAALPLYQSTELLRGLVLGDPGSGVLWAAVYLAVFGLGGLWLADRRLPRLLLG